MRDVTAAFLTAVRQSHPMQTRVRVLTKFQTGINPAATPVPVIDEEGTGIPVEDGSSVTYDVTADTLASLTLTTDGAGWDPKPGRHPLQPYGTEVFVERGIPGELVPLGYYRLNSVNQTQPPAGPLTIQGQDRMAKIVDAQLTAPVQFTSTQTVGSVFQQLVTDVYPQAVIEFDDDLDGQILGRAQVVDQDRYGFLRDLASSNGKLMYFDHRGVLVIRSLPDLTKPVWDVTSGANGVLVEASRSIDRQGVFNAVVAEGEAPDGDNPAVRIVVYDANPQSPTYWEGPFGKVPYFLSSPNLTRTEQAISAARATLERNLGLPYYADFTKVPNPALEAWDPITVKYTDRSAREVHVIQTLAVPLSAGDGAGSPAGMTGTTRERTTVRIAVEGVSG
ncbi:MAG: DUF5047 domain-containing protein [Streptosporangiales bacterium]|nr:DUF5047 domain-containing protein [Streptosporangiales bacterium]